MNITDELRHAIDRADVFDPTAIARTVVADWPSNKLREALVVLAAQYVTRVGHTQRKIASGRAVAKSRGAAREGAPKSVRWSAAAAAWKEFLSGWESLDGGQRVHVSEMTLAQVRRASERRREAAAGLRVEADRWSALAELMERTGALVVRDLRGEDALAVWSGVCDERGAA